MSVNYDGFIDDVSEGDILLVDGGINSLKIVAKEGKDVLCEVQDGGTLKSRHAFSCSPRLACMKALCRHQCTTVTGPKSWPC